ncbi:hypothetical protein SDC9_171124 [bioreactor metagenome]|uniref:Uncharacterized protein n=1 Tax=bioreactor metagenome TaxID=1076179 RepID=A0A645GA06_9ZZZZ
MGKQGVVAVEDMSNGIDLMGTQGDFGIDAAESDMLTVILTGANGVEFLIILFYKGLPLVGIVPYPISKRIFNGLLFLLCQSGGIFIQYPPFFSIGVNHSVIDTHITEV